MILRIKPVTIKAEGTYKCVISNSFGTIEKEGYLTVNCKFHSPSFFFVLYFKTPLGVIYWYSNCPFVNVFRYSTLLTFLNLSVFMAVYDHFVPTDR